MSQGDSFPAIGLLTFYADVVVLCKCWAMIPREGDMFSCQFAVLRPSAYAVHALPRIPRGENDARYGFQAGGTAEAAGGFAGQMA
jgi:hypothetical protein